VVLQILGNLEDADDALHGLGTARRGPKQATSGNLSGCLGVHQLVEPFEDLGGWLLTTPFGTKAAG